MKELMIYEFQAKEIQDTLRMVANTLGSRSKEACVDRCVCKSIEFIESVLGDDNKNNPLGKTSNQ